jgi:hypothetical protein
MPYSIGEKGSYGCSGYPVVKDGTSEVMGCHDSAAAAQAQITAITMSEAEKGKKKISSAIGQPYPADSRESFFNWSTPVRKPERSSFKVGKSEYGDNQDGLGTATIKEGDFVMGPTVDGMVFGRVEHIMWEGGTLGTPGDEYALESMPPENPAMSVRVYEVEENEMKPTPYSIGMMYQDAEIVDVSNMTMGQENEMEMMSKAETYSPNDGMKSAARRAIKWKEDGKAKGAGTAVGWGRARDIVAGRSMSLSVVKRMYSFFSRHEVDKKGKGFYDGPEFPSKGRVMWDAWGGDAGFSWSRKIVERESNKMFGDVFGKDVARGAVSNKTAKTRSMMAQRAELAEVSLKGYGKDKEYKEKAESIRVGQMVSWNSSGGRAQGKVTRIIRNGSYNVPNSDFVINGTEDNPAVVITLYRDGKPTDTTVAHRMSTLRAL